MGFRVMFLLNWWKLRERAVPVGQSGATTGNPRSARISATRHRPGTADHLGEVFLETGHVDSCLTFEILASHPLALEPSTSLSVPKFQASAVPPHFRPSGR